MLRYGAAILGIFFVMLAGIGVDRLYRRFAQRHPDLGPFREPQSGRCRCAATNCTLASRD